MILLIPLTLWLATIAILGSIFAAHSSLALLPLAAWFLASLCAGADESNT